MTNATEIFGNERVLCIQWNVKTDSLTYRKISNVSPGLIEVRKPFLGGLYSGGLIFGGHFMLVSEYQDLKNHCFI